MSDAIIHVPARSAAYDAALEGLTRLNQTLMTAHEYPPLYEARVRYKTEPREVWRHVADVVTEGWGDCEDLAAYRAAELRVTGEDPDAFVHTYKSAPKRYHAVVQRGDGSLEDPSRALGMGRKKRKKTTMDVKHQPGLGAACAELCGVGPAGGMGEDISPGVSEVTFDVHRLPGGGFFGGGGGWSGVVRIPLATGRAIYAASSPKATPQQGVQAALALASKALDSPAAQALLPPPARLALNVMRSPEARQIATAAMSLAKSGTSVIRKLF